MRLKISLLVRHAECKKNLSEMVGSSGDAELLTDQGIAKAMILGQALRSAAARLGPFHLYVADSLRARRTAELLAGHGKTSYLPIDSISMGSAAGLTEADLHRSFPETAKDLRMYRAGLLNSYKIRLPSDAEEQKAFEERTVGVFRAAVESCDALWAVFVLHRSPITTICIHGARMADNYPNDFFGHVPVGPTASFIISHHDSGFATVAADLSPEAVEDALIALEHSHR